MSHSFRRKRGVRWVGADLESLVNGVRVDGVILRLVPHSQTYHHPTS